MEGRKPEFGISEIFFCFSQGKHELLSMLFSWHLGYNYMVMLNTSCNTYYSKIFSYCVSHIKIDALKNGNHSFVYLCPPLIPNSSPGMWKMYSNCLLNPDHYIYFTTIFFNKLNLFLREKLNTWNKIILLSLKSVVKSIN